MSQAGGPAAINGFLYQIIQHLGWIADIFLSGELKDDTVDNAILVLEPKDGGDGKVFAPGMCVVEQYKARKNRTWSLAGIEQVLTDLRKAVPASRTLTSRYRFVTDGRAGRLQPFYEFLADLRSVSSPDDLDNTTKREFRDGLSATNDEFFRYLVAITTSSKVAPSTDDREVVFHMLFHFEMEFCADGNRRAQEIEGMLRRFVLDLGDERQVRQHLVGMLLEILSKGETRLDAAGIDSLLRRANLNPGRTRALGRLPENLHALTMERLQRLRFRPELDVRPPPCWPLDKPVLLITGDSGAGKTWALGGLLGDFAASGQPCTLVTAASSVEELKNSAAHDLWQICLGETSSKTLTAVSQFLRELAPETPGPILSIAVDDVRDVDLARALVRQDWGRMGMRLAMTVPQSVARGLQVSDGELIEFHSIGNFSVDELDELLQRKGRRWSDLPDDLKKLLRNPILAGLFLELPYSSARHAPRSEYEIFERFWQRIAEKGRAGDEGVVIALAEHYCAAKPYPLPRALWPDIGLGDEATASRLEGAGWLRVTDRGAVAFSHDRLLNWAVAEFLVEQWQRRELSTSELGLLLAGRPGNSGKVLLARLEYVPMDVIWRLTGIDRTAHAIGELIVAMESNQDYGGPGGNLYSHLLPTLGARAIPILLKRFEALGEGNEDYFTTEEIGSALVAIAQQESVDVGDWLDELLNSPSSHRQRIGLAVLEAVPDPGRLDMLWHLHQKHAAALDNRSEKHGYRDYESSFAALRAGSALDSSWLERRIVHSDPEEEAVAELSYLLHALEQPSAEAIWRNTHFILMAKVPSEKPRGLLLCIARFRDTSKTDFVVEHLSSSDDFANGAALAALAAINPKMAVDRLVDVEEPERYFSRNTWLPILMHAEPELARERIREIAGSSIRGQRVLLDLFGERPDDMDGTLLRDLLRATEDELREYLRRRPSGDPHWLHPCLVLLGRISRPDLLDILHAEAGGKFEDMLVSAARSYLSGEGFLNHVHEHLRRVLTLIGGDGLSALIGIELRSTSREARHLGMKHAFMSDDGDVTAYLAMLARRPITYDEKGKPDSGLWNDRHHALIALAAMGKDKELVEAVYASGDADLPSGIASLRAHLGPMNEKLTRRSRISLQEPSTSEHDLLLALSIAYTSGDKSLIPLILDVLERAKASSRVATYACIALVTFGDTSSRLVRLAASLLRTGDNAKWALQALLGAGTHGIEPLADWLRDDDARLGKEYADTVVRSLYRHPETREFSISVATRRCAGAQFLDDAPFEIAAESGDPELRERILDKAFTSRPDVSSHILRAIEGLAKFDARRALDAANLAITSFPGLELQACRLMVDISPDAAVQLLNAAATIDRESLRRAIGRTLRRFDQDSVSKLLVNRLSNPVPERKFIAEIAGWIPHPEVNASLAELARADNPMAARHVFIAALERHNKYENTRALMAAFPSATCRMKWSLLSTILHIADPYSLGDRRDPLWLGLILRDEPAVFAHYANSVLDHRMRNEKS